jgi:hypothetical protein
VQLSCPKCGLRDVRVSQRQGAGEFFRGLIGIYPLRCRRCNERWETSVWKDSAWRYARCPRCYRQELSTWSEQYYNPPTSTKLKLKLGATPYRCAACRCNFASFKRCKERFTWRHRDRVPQDGAPESALASPQTVGPQTPQNKKI